MTLSERLAAAARERQTAAEVRGAPAVRQAPEASEPVAAHRAQAEGATGVATIPRDGQRIIAPASTPVDVVVPDRAAAPTAICPTCGRTGELGMVDLPGRTADWSCLACGTLWQVSL